MARLVKRSLRDWMIFGLGLSGVCADAVYSKVFQMPPVTSWLLFSCSVLAAYMGGVGLPLRSLGEHYEGRCTAIVLTSRRLVAWALAAVVVNCVVSGIAGPAMVHDEAGTGPLDRVAENFAAGLLGALPWLVVNGVLTAIVTVVLFLVVSSLLLNSDEIITFKNSGDALRLGLLAFVVAATVLTPFGTVGWIAGHRSGLPTPVVELEKLSYSTVGVAIVMGIMLHYLFRMLPSSSRESLTRTVEVAVAGLATTVVTLQVYYAIGIGSEQVDRLPYVLLLPQFINVFVSLYYSTLWSVPALSAARDRITAPSNRRSD